MTRDIDALVRRLLTAHAALPDRPDLPVILTETQRRDYVCKTKMAEKISSLRNIENELERPLAQLADIEARRAATVAKQTEIEQAMASSPDWRSLHDGRARDTEYERQHQLKQQLRLLHENRLLRAPGEVFWNITDLDARIAELNTKIETLRATHDAYVEQAEALLTAPQEVG